SRMVTAVAITRAQRQVPRRTRTRVTSASCMLPAPACGSSNSIRFAGAAALSLAEADIIHPGSCSPTSEAEVAALFEPVRHVGLRQCRGAGLQPAVKEGLVVRRRVGLAVVGPCRREHLLALEQFL